MEVLWFFILFVRISSAESSQINGKHLRASASHFPPALIIKRDDHGNFHYSGREIEELEWLSRRLNFSYTISPAPDNIGGIKVNGSWTGVIGQIYANAADVGLYTFSISLFRYEAIDFAGFLSGEVASLLVKYPTAKVSAWAVFQPFTVQCWIAWVLSILAICLACIGNVLIRGLYSGDRKKNMKRADDIIMYIIGTFTSQGGYYRSGHKTLGILATVWCLAAFVFVNSYNSLLVSYLSFSYKSPDINSLAQLASSSTHKMVTMKGILYEIDILAATSGPMKVLGDKLLKCPSCRTSTLEEVVPKVLEENGVGILPISSNLDLIATDLTATGKCRLTVASESFGWIPTYWGVPKSSPYIEDLNRESMRAIDLGLYKKWKSHDQVPHRCLLKYNKEGTAVETTRAPLKLEQLSGAFLVLAIGYSSALVVFIVERISCWLNRRQMASMILIKPSECPDIEDPLAE